MFEVSAVLKRGSKEVSTIVATPEAHFKDATCVILPCSLLSTSAFTPDSWDALPQHILVLVLQHVPVQDRFRHCALVSTDWAAAAVESTTDICLSRRCHHLLNLQSWLVQHGERQITAVSLTGQVGQETVLLPCAKLRQLDLTDVSVQLLPTAGGLFPGVLRHATGLTRFTLQHAAVVGGPQALTGLATLTDLQHLTLSGLDTKQTPPSATDWFPVPGSIFSHLARLTHLELDRCVASSTLEHLEHLTSLEHLILGRLAVHNTTAAALSGLEHIYRRLRWLCVEGLESHISTSSVHGLGQLTGLTKLQLLNCKGFQPILLSGMLHLEVLDIQGTPLLGTGGVVDGAAGLAAHVAAAANGGGGGGAAAAVGAAVGAAGAAAGPAAQAPAGNADPLPPPPPAAAAAAADPVVAAQQAATQAAAQAAAGAAALLLELPKLQKLTHLYLIQVLWAHASGQPASAYAALTASSRLQHLDLSFSLIPAAAWAAIFQPGVQMLPHLATMNILCTQSAITDTDLEHLVQSCPGLRSLGLKGSIEQGSGLGALRGFSSMASLSVNHVSSDAALGVLAELRGLEDLQISVLSSIRASGLLQLTALRGLTRLRVESSPEMWIEKYGMVLFVNKAPPGCPSDVWAQLQRWCLHKIAQAAPAPLPPPEKCSKSSKLLRWLVRCVTE